MFSCDVLASETQSAPLWEEVSETEASAKARKTDCRNEPGTSQSRPHKRPFPTPMHPECCGKRRRMQGQYTECKLCELKFNNELELEEHLFSILHHRSLDTEFGECHHLCNLCGVACNNFSDYVQHLKNPKHRTKNGKRKAGIDVGSYTKPEYDLARYTSTFLCPPRKIKQSKIEEEANKKVDEIFSKRERRSGSSRNSSPRRQDDDPEGGYDRHHYYNQDHYRQYPDYGVQQPWKFAYPDWHPRGHYGQQRYRDHGYQSPYGHPYSHRAHNGYQDYNPYESGGWFPEYYHRMGSRAYDLEKSVYREKIDAWKRRDDSRKSNSRPPTPKPNEPGTLSTSGRKGNKMRTLTNGQVRTKQLVARAHQVIQNGQNVKNKVQLLQRLSQSKKRNKRKRKGKSNSTQSYQSSNSDLNISQSGPQCDLTVTAQNGLGRIVVPQRPGGRSSDVGLRKERSASCDTNQCATLTRSSCSSANASTGSFLPTSSHSSDSQSTSADVPKRRGVHERLGASEKDESKETLNKPRRRISQSVREKFQNHLNKELGPARMKKTPQRQTRSSSSISTEVGEKSAARRRRSNPGSTEDIRAQFRKILDDIDHPVMSASEIVRNAEHVEFSTSASETSLVVSWTESKEVSNTDSHTACGNSNGSSGNSSQTASFDYGTLTHDRDPQLSPVLTRSMTLSSTSCTVNVERNLLLDRGDTLRHSISVDSEKNDATPARSAISISSDTDTPSNKKRQNPQPNLNRARSRITSKQKDSPDVPSEIRQAKLKQLLQKYDKVKKNSPESTTSPKKTPGPRFGIELNLYSRPMETMDIEDLAKRADLVEILPEKRARSLSESDSMSTFTTAATESTTNLSSTVHRQNSDIPERQRPRQEQQRTSTPSLPPKRDSQNLNAELLKMSEREESLHASVRSLSVQEADVHSEIENKTAILKALQEQLEKLNEKKLCVEALKRRHEQELEKLRLDRLTLLRGSVSGTHINTSSPVNIFQDFTPQCRRVTPVSFGDEFSPNDKKTASALPDFDISKVKRERGSGQNDLVPYPLPLSHNNHVGEVDDEARKDDGQGKLPGSPNTAEKTFSSSSADTMCNGNSTEFYSFNNENRDAVNTVTQASEIDQILSKYTKRSSGKDNNILSAGASRSPRKSQKRKQETPCRRHSPRILQKEKSLAQKASLPSTNPLVTTTVTYDADESRNSTKEKDGKLLPKFFKAHDMPLIGMFLIKEGLITCSLDETIALSTVDAKKHSVPLGATPTAMTAISEHDISLVFVATQKVISKTQESDDSVVINKMEHCINVYNVSEPQTHDNVFQSHSQLKLKARVLCMRYDKQTLFCGMRDGMVAIIALDSLYQLEKDMNILECHSHSAITCLTTGMEGARRILCCGSADCTVSVRDAVEGLLLRTIQGHTKTVTCLQLVHNELYSASVDRLILCHNLNTGNLLHRFTGHIGVVRALHVMSNVMVTLCSDRNVRFFDTKTSRLIQKPKTLPSLPLFACVPASKLNSSSDDKIVYVGCEDSTVMRIQFPQIKPIKPSPGRNLSLPTRSKQGASSKSSPQTTNLKGEFKCQWEGCVSIGAFLTEDDLRNHVFNEHIDTSELTQLGDFTLKMGTCCKWDSCTHYFAPELDTVRDITAHVQRHFESLKTSLPNRVSVRLNGDSSKGGDKSQSQFQVAKELLLLSPGAGRSDAPNRKAGIVA